MTDWVVVLKKGKNLIARTYDAVMSCVSGTIGPQSHDARANKELTFKTECGQISKLDLQFREIGNYVLVSW